MGCFTVVVIRFTLNGLNRLAAAVKIKRIVNMELFQIAVFRLCIDIHIFKQRLRMAVQSALTFCCSRQVHIIHAVIFSINRLITGIDRLLNLCAVIRVCGHIDLFRLILSCNINIIVGSQAIERAAQCVRKIIDSFLNIQTIRVFFFIRMV